MAWILRFASHASLWTGWTGRMTNLKLYTDHALNFTS